MNVIVIDAFDWANRVGPDDSPWNDDDPTNDQPTLYEGVIAHELEHLLHNYSDPGELSLGRRGSRRLRRVPQRLRRRWLAPDLPPGVLCRHVADRWGGGLQNYGAAYTFFQYLWEQAGGNGDGTYTPDLQYDGAGGDLLDQADLREPGRRHDRRAGRHRRRSTPDREPTCAVPRSCSRTGRSPSTWTTRVADAVGHQGRRLR